MDAACACIRSSLGSELSRRAQQAGKKEGCGRPWTDLSQRGLRAMRTWTPSRSTPGQSVSLAVVRACNVWTQARVDGRRRSGPTQDQTQGEDGLAPAPAHSSPLDPLRLEPGAQLADDKLTLGASDFTRRAVRRLSDWRVKIGLGKGARRRRGCAIASGKRRRTSAGWLASWLAGCAVRPSGAFLPLFLFSLPVTWGQVPPPRLEEEGCCPAPACCAALRRALSLFFSFAFALLLSPSWLLLAPSSRRLVGDSTLRGTLCPPATQHWAACFSLVCRAGWGC